MDRNDSPDTAAGLPTPAFDEFEDLLQRALEKRDVTRIKKIIQSLTIAHWDMAEDISLRIRSKSFQTGYVIHARQLEQQIAGIVAWYAQELPKETAPE